jgi:hypothetical protein
MRFHVVPSKAHVAQAAESSSLFSGLRGRFARVRCTVYIVSGGRSECRGAAILIVARLEIRLAKQDLHDHYRP